MIYITGDTHIPLDIYKIENEMFPEQKDLTKSDYVIIAGDFGGVWGNGRPDNYYLNKLNRRNYTTLWVDGNHENFELLKQYKVEEWKGGKVQFIKDSIIHLMRGQVYEIEGLRFFTFGGGNSADKAVRTPGLTWWPDEMPNKKEYREGIRNLKKNDFDVDYIISHTAPYSINLRYFQKGLEDEYKLGLYLDDINERCEYKHHFFGHFHVDREIDDKHTALYQEVVRIL